MMDIKDRDSLKGLKENSCTAWLHQDYLFLVTPSLCGQDNFPFTIDDIQRITLKHHGGNWDIFKLGFQLEFV